MFIRANTSFLFFFFLSFFAAWFDWKFAWLSLVPFFIQVLLKCRLKEFVSILRNIIPTASRTIKFLIQSKTLIFISSYFSLNNSLLQYPMRNLFHFKLRCLSYTNIIQTTDFCRISANEWFCCFIFRFSQETKTKIRSRRTYLFRRLGRDTCVSTLGHG